MSATSAQGAAPQMSFTLAASPVFFRRARALHRRQDDGDPPRQASRRLRHQSEQGARIGTRPRKASIEELLAQIGNVPENIRTAVRNNGGGHLNHSMFWKIMKKGGGGEPTGALGERHQQRVRQLRRFQDEIRVRPATTRFGSGWAWLLFRDGKLAIESTANQDNPVMDGGKARPRPRRLGARLLSEVSEPPPGLHRRLVERRQLGSGG